MTLCHSGELRIS